MPKLVCQSGPDAGREYRVTKDVTVLGRQSSCDVQIHDSMASRAHCHVRRDGKLWSLVDLGSRNGTMLNDKRTSERQLVFGDRIRVGQAEYVFVKEPGDVELKDLLSKYEVQDKLGEGGMGIVYRASQRSMARSVALKILSPKYASRPKFVEQFIREARAAGALNHPNIIQVHDVGTENEIHFFSMEFVDGSTCMQILRADGPFPPTEALEIARQTAKALEYAHNHRLIHQDIKPDNIMIGPNNLVKLADLGISKTFDEVESEGDNKKVMGTPHYMAPEAALGKKIDHRVDIYSLGATLYHLLTGKTPYHGTSATEVLKAHVMDPLPPLQDLNPEVTDDISALVERMMAKKPEDRYQSAADIVAEIERLQGGSTLGRERIAGTETMILRRFASGKAASPPGTAAGAPTTGDHTPDAQDAVPEPGMRWASALGWVLGIAALGLAAVAAWLVLAGKDPAKPELQPTAAPHPQGQTQPRPTPVMSAADAASEAERKDAYAIGQLADRLRKDGDTADIGALSAQLGEITVRPLTPANRLKADELKAQLAETLRRRQASLDANAFADLEKQALKLADERNWDLALNRLDAFKGKDDPQLGPKIQRLKVEILDGKKDFLSDLDRRIKVATTQKDLARLKQLRDQLPKSLLGGEWENKIASAAKGIENESHAAALTELSGAQADLARWDFAKVEERHKRARASLGESAQGRQFDDLLASAKRLPELAKAIDTQLQSRGKVRFHGTLSAFPDPDLTGADQRVLRMIAASGGDVEVPWVKLSPSDIAQVGITALGEDFEKYRATVNILASARVGTEK